MTKKLITWQEFDEAVSAQAPWLASSWFAFTNEGVVLLSDDELEEVDRLQKRT